MALVQSSQIRSHDKLGKGNGNCGASISSYDSHSSNATTTQVPFPLKLHDMLDTAESNGFDHIVSWQHGGRAFKVHKPDDFVNEVLPLYFNQTRYKSFQRQLNIYGFTRVSRGSDKGLCFHDCFVRGEKHLCKNMERQKIKCTSGDIPLELLAADTPVPEPSDINADTPFCVANSIKSMDIDLLRDLSTMNENEAIISDVGIFEGRSFFCVDKPTDSRSSSEDVASVVTQSSNGSEQSRTDSFPWKLHDMLTDVESNGLQEIVSWEHDGLALKVHKPKEFVQQILPLYFSQSRLESFQRQLNLYGFKRIARGPRKGTYHHKFFVREKRELCRQVTRKVTTNPELPRLQTTSLDGSVGHQASAVRTTPVLSL